VVTADGPTVRTSQFRLVMPDDGLGFEIEPYAAQIVEADGRRWQVRQADKAVADSQRICQCSDLGLPTTVAAAIAASLAPAGSAWSLGLDGTSSTGDGLTYAWTLTGPSNAIVGTDVEGFLNGGTGGWLGDNPGACTLPDPGSDDTGGLSFDVASTAGSNLVGSPLGGYVASLTVTSEEGQSASASVYLSFTGSEVSATLTSTTTQGAAIAAAPTAGTPTAGSGTITVPSVALPAGASFAVVAITQEDGNYCDMKTISGNGTVSFTGVAHGGTYTVGAYGGGAGRNGPLATLATGLAVP